MSNDGWPEELGPKPELVRYTLEGEERAQFAALRETVTQARIKHGNDWVLSALFADNPDAWTDIVGWRAAMEDHDEREIIADCYGSHETDYQILVFDKE